MRFRIADFRLGYKLNTEKRKRQFLLCYTEMLFTFLRLRSLLHAKARCDRGRFWPSRPLRCRH